ncbi:MAG TPA: hypothetical protein VN176_00920 [Verrucomicrobiae bacterium]|nr:hypothetical protein [Verrucomicrobiae bacterium]
MNLLCSTLQSVLLSGLLLGPVASACAEEVAADRSDAAKRDQRPRVEPTYKIQAGLDGEIYPVFANYASLQKREARSLGVVSVTVSNPGTTGLRERMAVKIVGWSDQEIQIADIGAGATQTLIFAPAFLPRFYQNHEIIAATAQVSISDMSGHSVYEATMPVRLRSSEDMYWGSGFKYAPFIASWVTPHDARVEAILAQAKEYTPDRRLPGYEPWKNPSQQEQETYREARAIFMAVKHQGMSYVKSSDTLGDHKGLSERVRMPGLSLSESSANCIDAAVMYASLFENLGMEATVVIVPGHAYAGVRVSSGPRKFLLIDVALTGRSTFEHAVASAEAGMAKHNAAAITRITIPEARSAGIYPMP